MSALASKLRDAGVKPPVRVSAEPGELGVLLDADGRDFATIDVNGERPDKDVAAIAAAVAEAINAGVRAATRQPASAPASGGGRSPGRPLSRLSFVGCARALRSARRSRLPDRSPV